MSACASIFVCVAMVLRAAADDEKLPKGIFVVDGAYPVCIEFSDDGRCFLGTDPFRFENGQVEKRADEFVCKFDDDELVFSIRDGVLLGPRNQTWMPREKVLKPLDEESSQLTILVRDERTKQPITSFEYSYELTSVKGQHNPLFARPVRVDSQDGTFSITAPKACEIRIEISGRDLTAGYGSIQTLVVSKFNTERELEVLVESGARVSGTVVDAVTGEPIADAVVSPTIFTPPLFSPDYRRQTKTNAKGEFTLYGVEPSLGVHVEHEAYYELQKFLRDADDSIVIEGLTLELRRGPSITGIVTDADGKPIANVEVSDGSGKSAITGNDGQFTLLSPSEESGSGNNYRLTFEKDGYLRLRHELSPDALDEVKVIIQRQPVLKGSVKTSSGQPVPTFLVAAGSGRDPGDYSCEETVFNEVEEFSIAVRTDRDYDNESCVWVGIKAEGFAVWETTLPEWESTHSIDVMLSPGVTIQGAVANRKQFHGPIEAHILPLRQVDDTIVSITQRQKMGRMSVAVNEDGSFEFAHVARGRYILAISGKSASPVSKLVEVGDADLPLGVFSLKGTGTITGIAWQNPQHSSTEDSFPPLPKRQAFADGYVRFPDSVGYANDEEFPHLRSISFKTDEAGRFRVENVPVGTVNVNLPFWVTADILGGDSMVANVTEGQTTVVEFHSPFRRENVRCKIVVGDGSETHWQTGTGLNAQRKSSNVNTRNSMFLVSLVGKDSQTGSFPSSDWEEASDSHEIRLSDVGPGRYQLVVNDWLMSRGFMGELYRTDIVVTDKPLDVQIPLGAGCRTGVIQWKKDFRSMIHVVAKGKQTGTIRRARCDDDGNFCLRYLPLDTYQIYAHDFAAGWVRLPDTPVQHDSADLGTHELTDGATLRARLPVSLVHDQNVSVVAVDENGIPVEELTEDDLRDGVPTFSQLWPGKWTIHVRRGETNFLQGSIQIHSTEAAEIQIAQ